MRLGIHLVDSTPSVGTYLGGYARFRDANGVRDRLRASALVVESDAVAVVLCLDLVFAHSGFVSAVRDRVRRALGRDDVAVTIACSHSHATPYGTWGAPSKRFQDYADRLVGTCLAAVVGAWESRVEGTLHFGAATTGIGINRRLSGADGLVDFGWNEDGPYDPTVRVIAARDNDGALLGTLVGHGCHPICLPPWSRLVSADWVGELRKAVERQTGAPCLFAQGACADVNPRHEWVPRRLGKNDIRGPHAAETDGGACEVLGGRVAVAVGHALERTEPVEPGPVTFAERAVTLGLVPEPDPLGGTLEYWHGVVRSPRLPRWLVDPLLQRAFPWETPVSDSGGTPSVELAVQAVRIGSLALAAHGSEAFCETGLAVVERSPTPHTLFVGYANGMVGYVPPPEELPRRGYEVDMVPYLYRLPGRFSPDAEPAARAETLAMLGSLFEASPAPDH